MVLLSVCIARQMEEDIQTHLVYTYITIMNAYDSVYMLWHMQ